MKHCFRFALPILLLAAFRLVGFGHETNVAINLCPFCSAVQQTISEQMGDSDVVVIASMIEKLEVPPNSDELPKAEFEVTYVVKGLPDLIGKGDRFRTIFVGNYDVGQKVMVMGVQPPKLSWTTPIKVSAAAEEYLRALPDLPKNGPERLQFFQNYLESPEPLMAFDAYEEFARASYAEVTALKPWLKRDRLLGWIKDPDVSTNRKRLYFTLLGICGTADDLSFLESRLKSEVKEDRRGLDALIACYLTIKGANGLNLIDQLFFEDPKCDYVDAFAAISAIRFLATEDKEIPRERILASFHKVLKTPERADLVIPDLARWEDWSVIDEMVALFKNADEKSKWVRVPVVSYLQVCPKPEAKEAIAELTKLDPEVVRRAQALLNWESGGEGDDWGEGASDPSASPPAKQNGNGAGANSKPDPAPAKPVDEKSRGDRQSDFQPVSTVLPRDSAFDQPAADETGSLETVSLTSGGDQISNDEPSPAETAISDAARGKLDVAVYRVNRIPAEGGGPSPDFSQVPTANDVPSQYVSTNPSVEIGVSGKPRMGQPAESIAAQVTPFGVTMTLILLPFGAGGLLFLLLWSVLNGWFERLIF